LKRWSRAKKESLVAEKFARLRAFSQSRQSDRLSNTEG
jgi:predicted GIY-YIG superfamily endonuclease